MNNIYVKVLKQGDEIVAYKITPFKGYKLSIHDADSITEAKSIQVPASMFDEYCNFIEAIPAEDN